MATPPNNAGGSRPVPDPSVLTTDALQREVAALTELVELRITGLRELLEEEIKCGTEVRSEEFRGVKDKLALIEQQRVEQKADTKAAVDAALTAQKEAVAEQTTASERSIAKSEAATTKSIEQLGATFNTAIDGQRRETNDLKERLTAVEQQKIGGRRVEEQHTISMGQVLTAIGVAFAALGAIAAVVVAATS